MYTAKILEDPLLSFGQFLDKVLRFWRFLWSEEGGCEDDGQVLWAHQVGGLVLGHSAHGGHTGVRQE